jgi:hypothetical protein
VYLIAGGYVGGILDTQLSLMGEAVAENRGALVESFDEPPHYRVVPEPQPDGEHEIVDVLAVGIHPATRGIAAGRHYTSRGSLPVLAGADAVVRRPDGSLAYVMAPGAGTLAERIAIDPAAAVPVPAGADTAVVAATMNPALSSWAALRGRAGFQPGQSVLVMGATGNAGSMAVRAARRLGASRVVAAGRNQARLRELLSEGADEIVAITADENATAASFAAAAADVDVVLDYVWGPPAELAIRAISDARTDHVRLLEWAQVGPGHRPRRIGAQAERAADQRERVRIGPDRARRASRTRRRGRRGRTHRHSAPGSACRGRAGMVPLGPPRRAHGDYSLTRRSLSCGRGPHCHGSFMYGT